MASSRQEYFILRNDVPIVKTNNFLRNWLRALNTDHVQKGELLVKESQPHDSSHAMYSLALDKSKKVACPSSDVAPLNEDDYEWLAGIQKSMDRYQVYAQRDKFEAIKKLQVGDKVWVCLPVNDEFQLPGSSCCHGTVQYIGPLQDHKGRWIGVELREERGNSDGSFRDSRYFLCEDGYAIFVPANHIILSTSSLVATTTDTPAPATVQKRLLLSAEVSATEREFYLNDCVHVFDKDGKRVSGVVKWACPGKEFGLKCHIIGIETDTVIKRERVEEHIRGKSHIFNNPEYKKHTYLAVPEQSVLKEEDGTPVSLHPEAMNTSSTSEVTNSVLAVATGFVKNTKSTTGEVLSEQTNILHKTEAKKEKAMTKELAESFGVNPDRRQAPSYDRQGSLEHQVAQPIPSHPVSYNLEVGTAVELVDPPGYGTIRWIGKFSGVNQDIAGVELETKVGGCGDGSWKGERYFSCKDGHALFIVRNMLKPDRRQKKRSLVGQEPIVQPVCSCACQLVKDQMMEVKAKIHYHDEQIATVKGQVTRSHNDNVKEIDVQISEHKRQVGEEITTIKGQVVGCEEALQTKDQQIEELQQMVAGCEEAVQAKDQQIEKLQQMVAGCEEAVQAKDQQIEELQEAIQAKDQQIEELQQMFAGLRGEFTTRLSAMETQLKDLQPPWAIPEAELEVTTTVLGKGAYGEVRVGVYHGDRVAVKRLHNVIASDYYHKMIQREMGIAARLRHPKLVLFIGAVTTGNFTIVTELMETSLRSELEHGRLKEAHLLPISRDIASALCYLHSLPEPIIHRDVSSANVLLNSRQGGWTAKLGDYGSANFQAKLQTVGPGCPAYAAPEADKPKEQGPKMDVYSYGVLLLEVCSGTLPDPRYLPAIQQAVHTWGQPKCQLGVLACQCTHQSSDRRPHMRAVVTQLDGM